MRKISLEQLQKIHETLREPSWRSASEALTVILEELHIPVGDTTAYDFHRGKLDTAHKNICQWLKQESEKLGRMKKIRLSCIESRISRQECLVGILGRLSAYLEK